MERKLRNIAVLALSAIFLLAFAACGDSNNIDNIEPESTPQAVEPENITEYALTINSADDLEVLSSYPNLKTLDLQDSKCYDVIVAYVEENPNVLVSYKVDLGGKEYSCELAELTLENGSYSYEALLQNLQYLPNVTELTIPMSELDRGQIAGLREKYPSVNIEYTVSFLGDEVSGDAAELDISNADVSRLDEIISALQKLSGPVAVELMDEIGASSYTMEDVRALTAAAPQAQFHYTFELFGKTYSTADERIEFVEVEIGDEGLKQIRAALDIMPGCTYVKLDRCGTGNEQMAMLRDEYPNVEIVWRVFFSYGNALTDTKVILCTNEHTRIDMDNLKYCTQVEYMDIGHNTELEDVSFVSYMPKLKVIILVDSAIETLEPFSVCKELEYLEIVNCHNLTDLSPLADCVSLKGLNMSCAFGIKDLSPLYELENLERLYLGQHTLSQEQQKAIAEHQPDCWITYEAMSSSGVSKNYAVGWRLDGENQQADWYAQIRKIFRYGENFYSHYNFEDQ